MFNRRMFVALAVCLVVSASSAFAGGGGGAKKDSTIKVTNTTANVIFAFVDVDETAIVKAQNSVGPGAKLAAIKALGGKWIAAGGSANFSVKTGVHMVIIFNSQFPLILIKRTIVTEKGQTASYFEWNG